MKWIIIAFFLALIPEMICPAHLPAEISTDRIITLDENVSRRIGHHLDILIDRDSHLAIDAVTDTPLKFLFNPATDKIPNMGIIRQPVWARFTIRNPHNEPVEKYLSFEYPLADHICLYIPDGADFKRMDAGSQVRTVPGLVSSRYYVFPLIFGGGETKTFYLRCVSRTNTVFPLTLWDPAAFHRQENNSQLLFGIIFGILLASVAYFIALGIKLKDPAVRWFSGYIICLGVLLSIYQGYLQPLFKPFLPGLNSSLHILLIGSLYFTGAKFFRIFLKTPSHSLKTDRIMQVLQWMGIGFIPMNLLANPLTPLYSVLLIGIGPFFSSGVSVFLWCKGVPNAKYFAIGWLVGHATSVIDLLRAMNLVPWTSGSSYLIPVGMIFTIVFFSIALLDQLRADHEHSHSDSLTGTLNRRGFDVALATEWNRHLRSHQPLSILLIDVDRLKEINDKHGHSRGDSALKAVGEILRKNTRRAGDLAARYGGDEFAAILPETEASRALLLAEKIRRDVENITGFTVSIGVSAMVPGSETTVNDLVNKADALLYQAKGTGRNRVLFDSGAGIELSMTSP